MTPFAIIATIVLCLLTLRLQRRAAVLPLIISALYMTLGQKVMVASLDFTIMRIIVLFAWARIFWRGEIQSFEWKPIDKIIVSWVVVGVIAGVLLAPTMNVFINRLGFAYNVIGIYFFFRAVIMDYKDVDYILSVVAILILPLAFMMIIEKVTARNIFSVFGGVSEITYIRGGRLRCQGPFQHPILAGTVGATLMPLMIGRWIRDKGSRAVSALGIIGATIITVTSTSSGPAIAYIFGIIGLLMWPMHDHMRIVRRAIIVGVISLHLVMKAPVWFLIGRLGGLVGGHGYHRSALIDAAIKHFDEWWLIGTGITAHWMPYVLPISPNYVDITNEYIAQGVTGGVLKLGLFIMILVHAFKAIGNGMHPQDESGFAVRFLYWSLGASLFAHMMSFISVSYFDQIIVFWYLLLAMIATAAPGESTDKPEKSLAPFGEIHT